MNAIIFSKNRAMQCDALLRSIKQNCKYFTGITVQYVCDDSHEDSYDRLSDEHLDVDFVHEIDFKQDFLLLVEASDHRVALFVDDDIVHRPVNGEDLWDLMDEVDIVSLRLGLNITVKSHFDYKGSVDGNIFKRDLLLQLDGFNFHNPNKMEINLCKLAQSYTMGYFTRSKVIGIPANKVSGSSTCVDMGLSADLMEKMYMAGIRIDYEHMDLNHYNVHKNEKYNYKQC